MADAPKTSYTLAEVREKERQAFVEGACWHGKRLTLYFDPSHAEKAAAKRYPAPTKPRVVRLGRTFYRVHNGRVEYSIGDDCWRGAEVIATDHVPAVADLLAHPEEPADA